MSSRRWLVAALVCALAGVGSAAPEAPQARAAETFPVTPYYRWIPRGDCGSAPMREVAPGIQALLLETKQVPIPEPGKSVTETWIADLPGPCARVGKSCGFNLQAGAPQLPSNVTAQVTCLVPPSGSDRRDCDPVPDTPTVPPGGYTSCTVKFTITLTSAKACECKALRAGGRGGVNIGDPDRQGRTHLRLTVRWVMVCDKGPGGCEGDVEIVPPRGWSFLSPAGGKAACKGRCGLGNPSTHAGDVKLHAVVSGFGAASRAGKSLTLAVRTFCTAGGERKPAGRGRISIVFDRRGLVDTKRSDVDADGRPDRR